MVDKTAETQIINGTITAITSDMGAGVTKARGYVFSNCPLTSISLPNITEIGTYCFDSAGTSSLDVSFPSVTKQLGSHCLDRASGTYRFPAVKNVDYVFTIAETSYANIYLLAATRINHSISTGGELHIGNGLTYLGSSLKANPTYFHFSNSDTVSFTVENAVGTKGTSKSTKTYYYRTDNTAIKDRLIACGDSYTTINVKHLDGSDW